MMFLKWWFNELIIPGVGVVVTVWLIAVLLRLLQNSYILISNVTHIN